MPSARRTLLAALAAALATTAAAGGRAPAAAQADPPPRLEAALWAAQLSVPALPGQFVEAEVRRPDGSRLLGVGSGDADGRARLQLVGGGGPAALRPGDVVRIAQSGQRPLEIAVPALGAQLDTAADRLEGTAPAGAVLAVLAQTEQAGPDGSILHRDIPAQAVAGDDGRWTVDFGAGGTDLPAGRTRGQAWIDTPDRDRFLVRFADARLDATLGAYEVRGLATPGRTVRGTVERPGAEPMALPPRPVIGDGSFALGTAGFGMFGPPPPDALALAPGDRIELVVAGDDGAVEATRTVTLPALAVAIDAGRDRVTGTAPADSPVRIEAAPLDGAARAFAARAGADGAFAADLSGAVDLGPGWLVRAGIEPSAHVAVAAVSVVPQTRVGVGLTYVRGLAEPGTPITVTLRAASGAQRRLEPGFAGADGQWSVGFGELLDPSGAVEVRAGDRIEIAAVDGDPQLATVPALTALADAERDTVGGTAPPGARLRVASGGVEVATTADAAGRWSASFAGRLDLAAPMGGEVRLDDGAFAFHTTWSVVRLNVELGANRITGNGPRGRALDAVLRDAEGRTVARATGRVFDQLQFGSARVIVIGLVDDGFDLSFDDVTGQGVPIQPGDVLQLTAGDQTVSFVVPPLDGAVFVDDDVVSGRTRPGATIRLRVQRGDDQAAEAEVVADANGTFSHRFAPVFDLLHNDLVQIEAEVGGHRVTRYVGSPGIQVDLDRAAVQGRVAPDARVRIELQRGGLAIAGVETQSGPDGDYQAALLDRAGRRLTPRSGDRLTVTPIDPAGPALAMTVPELTVDADAVAHTVGGRATPGGSLAVLANDPAGDDGFGFGQAWPEPRADGTWTADFVPSVRVRPGLSITARYRTGDGHVAVRTRVVPLLSAEHGGPNACGWTMPAGTVTTELRDPAGRIKGRGEGVGAPWDGAFHTILRDGASPVTSATSDTVAADLSGSAAEVVLPPLDLAMDWSQQRLTGRVTPGTAPLLRYPAQRCGAGLEIDGPGLRVGFSLNFGAAPAGGAIDIRVPLPIAAGQGFEIAQRTASGHRVYRQFWRSRVEAYLTTPRVTGTTNALAAVALTLRGADGAAKGTASGAADASGRYDLAVRAADGTPVALAPGDRLTAVAGGDSAELGIEAVAFDWSPGGPIAGTAPAGRAVALTLRLADGRRLSVPRAADDAGRFAFGADEVPLRAGWTLDDVVGVRVALETAGGHAVIDQSADFDAPDAPPARDGRIFLPALLAKAALGATPAVAATAADVAAASAPRAVGAPDDEPQARPDVVHRAYLVVDPAGGQADSPHPVLVEIGGHAAGPLRPRDP